MSKLRLDLVLGRLLAAFALAVLLPAGLSLGAARAEAPAPQGVVNINTARAEELMLLPRIGEEKARRIIEQRTKAPFKTVNELTRVKGIGMRTLRTLKPWVRIDGPTTLTSEAKPLASEEGDDQVAPSRPAPARPATGGSPGR